MDFRWEGATFHPCNVPLVAHRDDLPFPNGDLRNDEVLVQDAVRVEFGGAGESLRSVRREEREDEGVCVPTSREGLWHLSTDDFEDVLGVLVCGQPKGSFIFLGDHGVRPREFPIQADADVQVGHPRAPIGIPQANEDVCSLNDASAPEFFIPAVAAEVCCQGRPGGLQEVLVKPPQVFQLQLLARVVWRLRTGLQGLHVLFWAKSRLQHHHQCVADELCLLNECAVAHAIAVPVEVLSS